MKVISKSKVNKKGRGLSFLIFLCFFTTTCSFGLEHLKSKSVDNQTINSKDKKELRVDNLSLTNQDNSSLQGEKTKSLTNQISNSDNHSVDTKTSKVPLSVDLISKENKKAEENKEIKERKNLKKYQIISKN